MANNTEVIFENIEQRIIKEIEDAHYAIFVSVAWFTNKKLFNALLEKAKVNCYVSIIIQLDEINSQCGIDYSQIQVGRSECFNISKDAELLHDKFCVIDFKKVITGSYNWTYKASQNSENILILDDPSVATQYISRFEQQKAKFQDLAIQKNTTLTIAPQIVETPSIKPPKTTHEVKQITPSIKHCHHCEKEIGCNDTYCQHCGKIQNSFLHRKMSIVVTCKKCSHRQDEFHLDAEHTKYCTVCGSNKLEWKRH